MDNKKVELSIIIPIYNGQNTVEKCLNSILNQLSDESEVIMIDDGSTDKTNDICSRISEEDSRVKLIKQENSGVSIARNVGIEAASGKYIMFIDCDDIIRNGYFGAFIRAMSLVEDKTIVMSRITTHIPEDGSTVLEGVDLETDCLLNKDKLVDIWDSHIWNAPFNKIYLRDIIQSNDIRFDKKVRMGEDWLFNNAYVRALEPTSFYIVGDVSYDYFLNNNPWRHCTKEEFYEINKNQVDDFKYTLQKLKISKSEVEKFDKRDLDFTISELRRISRDDCISAISRIRQIDYLAQKEKVFERIKKYKGLYGISDNLEFVLGSSGIIFIWENIRKRLGAIRNGGIPN